jgi:hypothetical protein
MGAEVMKKRIQNYMKQVDALLKKSPVDADWSTVLSDHLIQLSFYQHERLVHLLVTMLVAILTMLSVGIGIVGEYPYMFIVSFGLMTLLVPYLFHFCFLENAVQKMYQQYDEIVVKVAEKGRCRETDRE